MNLIHEIDPGVNYVPVYSVEYRVKYWPNANTEPMAWTQHGRTQSKFMARILALEVWVRYRKTHDRRVRVL